MNKAETAILQIFRRFEVKANNMLLFSSFLSYLDEYEVSSSEFQDAMSSLIQSGHVEKKDNQGPPSAFFLTDLGYSESLDL